MTTNIQSKGGLKQRFKEKVNRKCSKKSDLKQVYDHGKVYNNNIHICWSWNGGIVFTFKDHTAIGASKQIGKPFDIENIAP